jgi:hypothetical protein
MNSTFFVAAFVAHNIEMAAKKDILGQKKDHSQFVVHRRSGSAVLVR